MEDLDKMLQALHDMPVIPKPAVPKKPSGVGPVPVPKPVRASSGNNILINLLYLLF